jgi:pimeloyl-ACP methyl ester carboxylesterase
MKVRISVTLVTLGVLLVLAAGARALPGPPLTEPPADLKAAMTCEGDGPKAPVLLVHGTFATAGFWNGNFREALQRDGHPVCLLTTPGRQYIDIQRSVEYVVAAVRTMYRRSHQRIAVVGHSQGALIPTVALRFWPDLAGKVSDFVGLAGVYANGTTGATAVCAVSCPPAGFQIEPQSAFLTAYAHQPLYVGPSYTSLASAYDEVVTPQPRASRLAGARNITLQDVCPGRSVDHMLMAVDALAYALALDAIEHLGSANPKRIDPAVCNEVFLEGGSPAGLTQEAIGILPTLSEFSEGHELGEPPLRCWLDPACAKPRVKPRLKVRVRRGVVRGRLVLPPGATRQCSGAVRIGQRTAALSAACRFAARVAGARRLRVRYPGSRELLPARARR